MKVIQVHTTTIPVPDTSDQEWYKCYIHTILFETDAGFYRVLQFGSIYKEVSEERAKAAYNYGKRVSVKRAVELFGSAISDKMDWADSDD